MADTTIPSLKICTKCGEPFPDTKEYFPRRANGKLRRDCRQCARGRTAKWRDDNPERARQWRDNHPGYQAKWYQAHKSQHLKRTKMRYDNNPQRKLTANDAWRKTHPEHQKLLSRNHQHRRRALKRASVGQHSAEDIEIQYRSQKGCCWWCGKSVGMKYHVDHVIPLSRGGSNAANNIVISCPECNWAKKDKLPQEWNGRLF